MSVLDRVGLTLIMLALLAAAWTILDAPADRPLWQRRVSLALALALTVLAALVPFAPWLNP